MSMIDTTSLGTKLKEVGRHSVIYGLGSVAQSAAGFFLLPILTGALTKNDFGVYSMILMGSTVSSAVFYLGMTSALPRSYFDYHDEADRRAVFTTAFLILLFGALLQSLIGYLGGRPLAGILVHDERYHDAVGWAFAGGSLTFINQYFFAYLRLLRKSMAAVAFSLMSLLGSVGLTLWLLQSPYMKVQVPFMAIAWTQLLIALVFMVVNGKEAFSGSLKFAEVKNLFHFGLASILASFGNMVLDWSDRVIIERQLTLTDVGDYSAAIRVAMLINILLILPFSQVWSPMMMEYRRHTNIKELFSRVFYYYLLVGAVMIVAASLFSKEILGLLIHSGVSVDMYNVFTLVLAGNLFYGAVNIVSAGFFYEREVYRLSAIYYAVAFVKIGINILVIPLAGIVGAAMGNILSALILPVAVYLFAKKYFSFPFEWRRIVVLALICMIPLLYVFLVASGELAWGNMVMRGIGVVIYLLLVYRFCLSKLERVAIHSGLTRLIA
jgi:O-antigen/teichoic acid export membrane protein